MDFVGNYYVLAMTNGRIRPSPKGNLCACDTCHLPRRLETRVIEDPSEDVAVNAVIAPGNPRTFWSRPLCLPCREVSRPREVAESDRAQVGGNLDGEAMDL